MPAFSIDLLRPELESLYASMQVRPTWKPKADNLVTRILASRSPYQAVEQATNVPWFVVAFIHLMEASLRFDRHLHNGDPLTARTKQVPAGRPATGSPPFTWPESAIDALTYDGLVNQTDWSVAAILFRLEKFNGFGYRRLATPIRTPYLWSGSNHYEKGKFTADGHFDPNATSAQVGAAIILKLLEQQGVIDFNPVRKAVQVVVSGKATTIPAFVEKGNSWVGARAALADLKGVELAGVKTDPKLVVSVAKLRSGAVNPSAYEIRDFDARNLDGVGYIDASDLYQTFLNYGLRFDTSTVPAKLIVTPPLVVAHNDEFEDVDDLDGSTGEIANPSVSVPKAPEPKDGENVPIITTPPATSGAVVESGPAPATATGAASAFVTQLVAVAKAELNYWMTNNLVECNPANMAGSVRVAKYWQEALGMRGLDGCDREVYWSAAFICYCMKKAGMPDTEFPYFQAHNRYIRWAVENANKGKPDKTYYGRKVDSYKPQLGDLIAAWRGEQKVRYDSIPSGFFPSHTDIVVSVTPTEIQTIGGNVSQKVSRKRWPAVNGVLKADDTLICVMECKK